MKTKLIIGLASVLALGLAACGAGTGNDDVGGTLGGAGGGGLGGAGGSGGSDAALAADTGVVVADPYLYVVVQDTEQVACGTNGPGSDIDAVELYDATGVLGVGLKGSAHFYKNPGGNACENASCSGGNCKYAAISLTLDPATLVSYTEGPADATVSATTTDTGYFSLNAGTLQLQIGDALGNGPAKTLKKGDYIKVFEVDQSYVVSGAAYPGCTCAPEHYTVSLQTATPGAAPLVLTPVQLDTNNATCDALTLDPSHGCGSTVFMVP